MFLVGLPFRGTFQLSLAVLVHYRSDTELFSLGSTARPVFSQHSQAGLLAGKPRLTFRVCAGGVEGEENLESEVHVTPVVHVFRNRSFTVTQEPTREVYPRPSPRGKEAGSPRHGSEVYSPSFCPRANFHRMARLPFAYSSPRGFGLGLLPFRSRLLRESQLISFPPLIDMLKFRG